MKNTPLAARTATAPRFSILFAALVFAVVGNAQTQNPYLVNFSNDVQSGLSGGKFYTHAIKLGETTSLTPFLVNGVSFLKTDPAGSRVAADGRTYSWAGFPGVIFGNSNPQYIVTPVGQEVRLLLEDFRHGGGSTATVSGLTPGFSYDFSFYYRCFDPGENNYRRQTITFDSTGERATTVISNTLYNAAGDTRVGYRYTANAQGVFSVIIDRDLLTPTANFCLWFFTNELLNRFVLPEPPGVLPSSGMLQARFAHNTLGAPAPDVTVWWAFADFDGGTDTNLWRAADGYGSAPAPAVPTPTTVPNAEYWTASAKVMPLLPSTNYTYRFMAVTSDNKVHWSEPGSFTSDNEFAIARLLAFDQAESSEAAALVRLVWTGDGNPLSTADLLVCWGEEDGGAEVDDWLALNPGFIPVLTNDCGVGEYSIRLAHSAVLPPNMEYFARVFAINSAGTNPAPETVSLITTGPSTWTALGFPDTAWTNAANWDCGVPLIRSTANFYHADALVTSGGHDLSVARALVNAPGSMVFDLGANTLFATNHLFVGGAPILPDYPALGGASMRLASGVIDLGKNSDLIIGNGAADPAQRAVGNSVVMEGASTLKARNVIIGRSSSAGANLALWNSLSVLGPSARLEADILLVGDVNSRSNTFLLADGVMDIGRITVGGRDGETRHNTAVISNSTVTLSGLDDHPNNAVAVIVGTESSGPGQTFMLLNSTLNIQKGAFWVGPSWGNGPQIVVFSNSFVFGSSSSSLQFGSDAQARVDIYQDPGEHGGEYVFEGLGWISNIGGNRHRLTVNNASLTFNGCVPNTRQGQMEFSGNNNTLVVNNGALKVRDLHYNTLYWGGGTVVTHYGSVNNRLELNGADARLVATRNFNTWVIPMPGGSYLAQQGNNSGLAIHGGRANLAVLNHGGGSGAGNYIHIAEATARLEAGTLNAHPGGRFEFVLPDNKFDETPVQVSGAAVFDPQARFEITAGPLFTGRQILVEAAGGIFSRDSGGALVSLDELPLPDANFQFTLPPSRVARVVQTGSFIEIRVFPTPTLFMVR